MVGERLHAEPIEMYHLSDVIDAPFVKDNKAAFQTYYESNPDILIEDISEFKEAIDKLEALMTAVSQDNGRDQDTVGCCDGTPPVGMATCNSSVNYQNKIQSKSSRIKKIEKILSKNTLKKSKVSCCNGSQKFKKPNKKTKPIITNNIPHGPKPISFTN